MTAAPEVVASAVAGAVTPAAGRLLASLLVLGVAVGRAVHLARRRAVVRQVRPAPTTVRTARDRWSGVLVACTPAPPSWVRRRLQRAGLTGSTPDRAWRCGVLVAVATVWAAGLLAGPGAAALVAVVVVVLVALVAVAVGDRATELVDGELPAVLATVAAGVRSGASLGVAIGEGAGRARGPVAEDLASVVEALAAGQPLTDALERWVRTRPTPGVRMTGAALALAVETGGAGARTIDGVAATLRDRLAVERELAALSSQARASAVVIGIAPVAFVLLTAMSDPGVWTFFLRTPAGLACLGAGCLLDAVGAGWMTVVARSAR